MRSLCFTLALALACCPTANIATADSAHGGTSGVIGWIEIRPTGERKDQVTVIGHAYGIDAAAGNFALSVLRTGKGGSAKTGQTGAFKVGAGQEAVLSRTAINVSPGASIIIELRLVVGGKEVFSTTLKSTDAGGGTEL